MPRDYFHFLNVNKPRGITSFAVVAHVRRLAGIRRIGHLGTLDPQAEGVLPLALGRATRLIEFVRGDKRYLADITLGVCTDTLDAEGQIVERHDATNVSREQIVEALARIAAAPLQVPPMTSALHYEGRRLYELFRQGRKVDVQPRPVRIDSIDLIEFEPASGGSGAVPPRLRVDIRCAPGTYVRAIARDLGTSLGCGAHLSGLVRTQRGPFLLDSSVSLPQLEQGGLERHLISPRCAVDGLACLLLQPDAVAVVRHGGRISMGRVETMHTAGDAVVSGVESLARPANATVCALFDAQGELIAIARASAGEIRPLKVFVVNEGDLR